MSAWGAVRQHVARVEERLLEAALSALGFCDHVARALGVVLLVLANVLIAGFTLTYFDTLLPLQGVRPFTLVWWGLTAPGLFLLFNILLNLGVCVLRDPGTGDRLTDLARGPVR